MKTAAALQSEHNTERLQLPSPAHWTELGPVPALGHGWESRTLFNSSSLSGSWGCAASLAASQG